MPNILVLLAAAGFAAVVATYAPAQDLPVADPAIASMTVDQLVEARQAAMKENGMIVRRSAGATGDEAVAAATTMLQNFTDLQALFPEGSVTAKSKALPTVSGDMTRGKGLAFL